MSDIDRDIDRLYNVFELKKLNGEINDKKVNFSISLPKTEKIEFLDTCYNNGENYKNVIRRLFAEYVKANGLDVCIARINERIERLQEEKSRYEKRLIDHTAIREKALKSFIKDEIEKAVNVTKTKPDGTTEKTARRNPPTSNEIRLLINRVRNRFNRENLAEIVTAIENEIKSTDNPHKDGLLSALEDYKFQHRSELPGYNSPGLDQLLMRARRAQDENSK